MRILRGTLTATLLLGLAAGAEAQAQQSNSYSFGLESGYAMQLTELPAMFEVPATDIQLGSREFEPGTLFGVRAGVRIDRVSLEALARYMPFAAVIPASGTATEIDATLFTYSANALVWLPEALDRLNPYLALGIGANTYNFDVHRSDPTTNLMLNFGLGMEVEIIPMLALRLDVRDNMSNFPSNAVGYDDEVQHSLQLALGLTYNTVERAIRTAMR